MLQRSGSGIALRLLLACVAGASAAAQDRMPQQDVVDVPSVGAGLCVHNLFQSGMVLQRDRPIRVRGWARPGEAIRVESEGEEMFVVAGADRRWEVALRARPASAVPTVLTITGADETLTLDDVLIGDVWVLGGQSNMEFPLERVDNGWLEIVAARFEGIRILTVPAQNGPEPKVGFPRLFEWSAWFGRHFRKGDWDVCSPEIARDLSAIGYVFARRIHMATGVPIGIIDVSRGGTTIEAWTPDAVLRATAAQEVQALLADWDARVASWDPSAGAGPDVDQNRPGNCYASMIAPLAGLAVKGVIFHQGYNNAFGGTAGARMYRQVLPAMIGAWRDAFRDPSMPFGIIALCTDGDRQTRDNFCEQMLDGGVLIREAQFRTFLDLRAAGDDRIGFASSYDLRRSWYHPQLKIPVGERISRWALATQYGMSERIRWLPPMVERMEVVDGSLVLRFDGPVAAADGGADIEGFAIAGDDRRFHPASARWSVTGTDDRGRPQYDRAALVLTAADVPHPVHFRYAWARNPMGNLQSADHNDLPLPTWRSDTWPMEDVPLGVLGDRPIDAGDLSRPERRRIAESLRQQDLQRRLREARALLEAHRVDAGTRDR